MRLLSTFLFLSTAVAWSGGGFRCSGTSIMRPVVRNYRDGLIVRMLTDTTGPADVKRMSVKEVMNVIPFIDFCYEL
jgi:hypothetical protein